MAIIGRPLLRVLEDVIGLVQLLELGLALPVALVAVGAPLHCELAIGLLERVLAGVARDAEDLVVVTLRHAVRRTRRPRHATAMPPA